MAPFLVARGGLGVLLVLLAGLAGAASEPRDGGIAETAPDPRLAELAALVQGSLDVSVDPQSLFEVSLSDEDALQVEVIRLRALLDAVETATRPRPRNRGPRAADAGSLAAEISRLDSAGWSARLALDRARLAFLSLDRARREALLQNLAERREAARPKETEEERLALEVEAEREKALEAANAERSEAERVVAAELARLVSLEASVNAVRAHVRDGRGDLAIRRDTVLGWQRRVREARAGTAAVADATYTALRRTLRASRDDLSAALERLSSDASAVPAVGPDPLLDVPPEIPTGQVRQRRELVARDIAQARAEERSLREERAATLLEEIDTLNRERLGLLGFLSPEEREAITGFTGAGWDQARSEARHLSLILRYHFHVAKRWLRSLRGAERSVISPWRVAWTALPWLLVGGVFLWGRRRTPLWLRYAGLRLAEMDRALRRTSPGPARRALRFGVKIHQSLEWFVLFLVVMWLLPASALSLLEVQLLASVLGWILASALLVNVINALAAGAAANVWDEQEDEVGVIRLRSLRLVGRTVVAFALVLMLSARLVGRGTIFSWVSATCWLAAVVVFLILVRWWRETVFQRIERARRKTPVQSWVLANRTGWKSFLAATLGAVNLFGIGVYKTFRTWLSEFALARRAEAFLFRRELERLEVDAKTLSRRPLAAPVLEAFDPGAHAPGWLRCPADEIVETILSRVAEARGGVVAIVGGRGAGKSSVLRAIQSRVAESSEVIDLVASSLQEVRRALGLEEGTPGAHRTVPPLVLLDDVSAVVKPIIAGLTEFDVLIALARAHCTGTVWIMAIDGAVWPFLRRARDARSLFDEVVLLRHWSEEEIGALLAQRCAKAALLPSYEDLLELPASADELDRADALKAKEAGYLRMLWDHARGNPGLALEVWRSSLAEDEGGAVHVRPLQLPDSAVLDSLPDASLFVLRAVLQLEPAELDDVAQATRLGVEHVISAVRFGESQGYFSEQRGRVQVTWRWLGPVVRVLERRHLLVNP